ncbi:MAG: hypothetical protein NT050_13975 [Verrucomicrobia bacterium]|nr:hypothetical protein [Verrucomicrobiota bacterium]
MSEVADIGERVAAYCRRRQLERLGPLGSGMHGNVFRAGSAAAAGEVALKVHLLWRAGLFRGAGVKMVRGDLMRGSGMVRRMGGVLVRESSRGTAEKLPRINSAGSTG